ncbi:ferredoxin--NADP reductase [Mucilaginibacter myungsuensis]|uniref:Ferredoxin--NADP reductase n=1 Tax=Mucilaginibacter myungsuensis TaxID=649104 RepID=A0A929KW26_9SPHI|nr:ferredoxin--NADP reductase [Mucilaginibacter myungsuensis]MBE9661498.1 ferredoxin--NADP reductase [Mucilaginibacter myungsuensis]MDN3597641.1 ferredoxin--NADP reductase [Mucilaginibacter myungsuensis]
MLELRVEAIRWETGDTATYFLREVLGKAITYKAGQFITLVFQHHGEELRRSYSISSAPVDELLAITVKRVPNGELSRFLLMHAKVGNVWQAVEPAGRFVLDDTASAKDIFFFAAGSGITPILSQIKFALAIDGASELHLIYSNRNLANTLFKAELDALQAGHPDRLQIIYLFSGDGQRLNNVGIEMLVQQQLRHHMKQAQFYLCGPFEYMRMVRLTLLYMGISKDHIRKENFVLDIINVSEPPINFPPHKVRLIFDDEVHDIIAGENQSILQAALQNNIQLPYSCRTGMCSTCVGKCTLGKVVMTANEVLTDRDITEGLVLTCTGYALGDDVVVEF